MALANKVIYQNGAIREFEKPEVCEAIKVANANRWAVALSPTEWDEREARLKKEFEERSNAPVPGKEQQEEKIRIICCSASPKADFYYKHVLNESNPALKESASQFNDALLDEQAKEIESLRDKCKKYVDVLCSARDKLRELKAENRRIKDSDLNLEGLIYATRELKEKNKKIEELTEENERLKDQVAVIYACKENNEKYNLKQIKRLGKEIARLNKIIHKKNLKIEELRKESSRHLRGKIKMFGENVDLEQMLKDKDAVLSDVAEELRLSKIREKNLTEVSQKYMKENEELKKKLAAKIVDKIDAQALKSAESALAYKEKVIAEKDELIQKMAKDIVNDRPVSPKDYEQYRLWAKGYGFNPQLPNFSEEEEKKHSLFRNDSVGAVTNQKDCSPAKDTHPAEDNPEQIEKDENLGRVRNALKNGRTVFIGYDKAEEGGDHSAIIAQCSKNIAISKDEAEIIERCTKDGTELHYSEKDGFTYTNMYGDEMPIICLRGIFHVFTDEEIKNMKK